MGFLHDSEGCNKYSQKIQFYIDSNSKTFRIMCPQKCQYGIFWNLRFFDKQSFSMILPDICIMYVFIIVLC